MCRLLACIRVIGTQELAAGSNPKGEFLQYARVFLNHPYAFHNSYLGTFTLLF